jgi:hypothetical protein
MRAFTTDTYAAIDNFLHSLGLRPRRRISISLGSEHRTREAYWDAALFPSIMAECREHGAVDLFTSRPIQFPGGLWRLRSRYSRLRGSTAAQTSDQTSNG